MIKTIIFDIGNVLTNYRWKGYFEQFGYTDDVFERITQATVKSAVWNEYDRGILTDEEMIAAFVENDPGIKKEIEESLANVKGIVVKFDYAIPWIKELKEKGYQVLVLSNFSRKARFDCAEALDFLAYVDGGILSYEEGVIKPQPEIYRLLLERYQLKAEECVFLDDLQVNIDAAVKEGIFGICFQNQAQAVEELRALGVES